jgi:hypothetical protein
MPDSLEPYDAPKRPTNAPAGNILELLDRILDKGLVIVGDIRISVADIELLKVQIRLLIASVDKAKELGIDFSWAKEIEQTRGTVDLQKKISELEFQLKQAQKESTSDSPNPSSSSDPKFFGT